MRIDNDLSGKQFKRPSCPYTTSDSATYRVILMHLYAMMIRL